MTIEVVSLNIFESTSRLERAMKQKIPLYKSLKFKINLFSTIMFLLVIIFLILNSNQNQQEMIQMKEDDLNQIAVETIDRRFKVSYQILETSLAQITASSSIVEAISIGDIDKLYKLVEQSYSKLQDAGVEDFNFYLPNNSLLLSMHSYTRNESGWLCDRTIVEDINSDPDHLPIKGVEKCHKGLFLRYIEPIYKEDQYIGSVELGMKVESRILNIFQNVSGGQWYLYSLDKGEESLLESTIETDNYSIDLDEELATSLAKGEVFKTEESPYIIQLIPIANYKGEYKNYFKRVFDNSDLIALQNKYVRRYLIYGLVAALISILLQWIIMTYLLNPLTYLEREVRKLELGVLVQPIEVKTNDEIGYLSGAMEHMRQSLYKRQVELKKQSYMDSLTGIYNRLYFDYKLKQIVREGLFPVSLIMSDIDGLKKINDKFGHAAGDAHIINCVETMKKAIRQTDKMFRIGGDEFILLFPNTDEKTGDLILSKVKKEIEIYNEGLEKDQNLLSISFGMGTCDNGSNCLEQILYMADKKMYEDKARNKEAVEQFN